VHFEYLMAALRYVTVTVTKSLSDDGAASSYMKVHCIVPVVVLDIFIGIHPQILRNITKDLYLAKMCLVCVATVIVVLF
jgi:hypothetical protein